MSGKQRVPRDKATITSMNQAQKDKVMEMKTFEVELERLDAEIALREANIQGLKVEIKNFELRKEMIEEEIKDRKRWTKKDD